MPCPSNPPIVILLRLASLAAPTVLVACAVAGRCIVHAIAVRIHEGVTNAVAILVDELAVERRALALHALPAHPGAAHGLTLHLLAAHPSAAHRLTLALHPGAAHTLTGALTILAARTVAGRCIVHAIAVGIDKAVADAVAVEIGEFVALARARSAGSGAGAIALGEGGDCLLGTADLPDAAGRARQGRLAGVDRHQPAVATRYS